MVNLQDVDDGWKRKRFEARIEQRSSTTSETECIENSNLSKRTGSEDLCASHTQRLKEWSEAESSDTTHILPDSSDADFSNAESNDAETLNSRHSLELIELGNNDFTLKEVPKLDGDSGRISDSSEDEEND